MSVIVCGNKAECESVHLSTQHVLNAFNGLLTCKDGGNNVIEEFKTDDILVLTPSRLLTLLNTKPENVQITSVVVVKLEIHV